jgi:CNP1-like family
MRHVARFVFGSCLLLCTGTAAAQLGNGGVENEPVNSGHFESDWERAQREKYWKEEKVTLPSYPEAENLIAFDVSATSVFTFFIDKTSLSVGEDGVVRYTLVARSPSGVNNVSYEGMHCSDGTYKVYAFGQPNRTWQSNPSAQWRPVENKNIVPWRNVLQHDYFCPQNVAISSAADGVSYLKRGGNPASHDFMQ